MHNLIIADDHPLFREAMCSIVLGIFPDTIIHECKDLESTVESLAAIDNVDLVLLDLNMPGMDGLGGLIKIRNHFPEIPVAIVSAEESKSAVLKSISYGAVGFITKSIESESIAEALKTILEGKVYLPPDVIRNNSPNNNLTSQTTDQALDMRLVASLTKRQLVVLEHMSRGESNKIIAYNLNIAETTVKAHVSAILHKLGVNNRIQAALQASKIDFNKLSGL